MRFGRALAIGVLIAAISSACYVATWEVMYFKFMPDFMEKYSEHELRKARASGGEGNAGRWHPDRRQDLKTTAHRGFQ